MTTSTTTSKGVTNSLTAGRLPRFSTWAVLGISLAVAFGISVIMSLADGSGQVNWIAALIGGAAIFVVANWLLALLVEGPRQASDRLVTSLVTAAFVIALIPLVWLLITVVQNGAGTLFNGSFLTSSMRNVVGEGGGALHAIIGTLLITGMATLISVPVGLLTAIYLVEYGRGPLARAITFFVDVMTGIPSIVAGLFAFAFFSLILDNPAIRFGFGGAVALSLLMIPVVVRSSEEMLKLVPNELREASYALGVPKWLTIVKIVIPTSIAGITTGVTLAISRVIGETAPLLIIAGFTTSMNYDLFNNQMMSLPVFLYTQFQNPGVVVQPYLDRSWAAALTLILIVMALNLIARLVAKIFSPKLGR